MRWCLSRNWKKQKGQILLLQRRRNQVCRLCVCVLSWISRILVDPTCAKLDNLAPVKLHITLLNNSAGAKNLLVGPRFILEGYIFPWYRKMMEWFIGWGQIFSRPGHQAPAQAPFGAGADEECRLSIKPDTDCVWLMLTWTDVIVGSK